MNGPYCGLAQCSVQVEVWYIKRTLWTLLWNCVNWQGKQNRNRIVNEIPDCLCAMAKVSALGSARKMRMHHAKDIGAIAQHSTAEHSTDMTLRTQQGKNQQNRAGSVGRVHVVHQRELAQSCRALQSCICIWAVSQSVSLNCRGVPIMMNAGYLFRYTSIHLFALLLNMLNYYDVVREENKASLLTTLQKTYAQNVNKTRNESYDINPSRLSQARSQTPSLSLSVALSRLVLSEFAWPLGSAFCCFFFIDFLKGTQNANKDNNNNKMNTMNTLQGTIISFFLLLNIIFIVSFTPPFLHGNIWSFSTLFTHIYARFDMHSLCMCCQVIYMYFMFKIINLILMFHCLYCPIVPLDLLYEYIVECFLYQ